MPSSQYLFGNQGITPLKFAGRQTLMQGFIVCQMAAIYEALTIEQSSKEAARFVGRQSMPRVGPMITMIGA
jgi:hypothetical protein